MKGIFFVFGIIFLSLLSFSQEQFVSKLELGDKLPDLSFKLKTDLKIDTFSFNKHNYKLVILDFWSIDCFECIYALPKMVMLQKKYGDSIKIIVVTSNTKREIDSTYSSLKAILPDSVLKSRNLLPFIINDSILEKLFPHPDGLPIHVWLDSNNKYVASAYATTTTENNISFFLSGKIPNLFQYYIQDIKSNNLSSWFQFRFPNRLSVKAVSMLTEYDEKTKASGFWQLGRNKSNNSIKDIICLNKTIPELYQIAYYGNINTFINSITFGFQNLNELYPTYKYPELIHTWNYKNRYCYYQVNEALDSLSFFTKMKDQLDSYFKLSSKVDSLKIECYILNTKNELNKYQAKGGVSNVREYKKNGHQYIKFSNSSIDDVYDKLFSIISSERYPISFINESVEGGRFDFEVKFNSQASSMGDLILELKNIGILLTKEYRFRKTILINKATL